MKRGLLALLGLALLATPFLSFGQGSTAGGDSRSTKINSLALSGALTSTQCGPGDTTCLDNNGVIGAPASGTTDPLGVMLRGKPCSASDGSCTPANVVIAGGMSVIDIQIDGADPSTSCAGDNDDVTFTVKNSNDTAVISAVQLLEGTAWTATASVANTCASLAAAFEAACTVSAVDYCNAVCQSPEVQVTLTPAASSITSLTESTAGCTTVSTLSYGNVTIAGSNLTMSATNGSCLRNGAAASAATAGGFMPDCSDADTVITGSGSMELWADGLKHIDLNAGIVNVTSSADLSTHQAYCNNAALTCADSGGGGAAACTATNADDRCAQIITCSDADGCDVTLQEGAPVSGSWLWVVNAGSNTVNIADSAGVQETNAGATLALGQYDMVLWFYVVDRWVQAAPISNN